MQAREIRLFFVLNFENPCESLISYNQEVFPFGLDVDVGSLSEEVFNHPLVIPMDLFHGVARTTFTLPNTT